MVGELDPFDFILAEALHMTIADMHDRMPNDEYIAWQAFYTYRAAQQQLAIDAAKARHG